MNIKIQIILSGLSINTIATKYNIGVSTVSEMCKREADIKLAAEQDRKNGKRRKTLKEATKPQVEELLHVWVQEQLDQGVNPRKEDIVDKAKEINVQLTKDSAVEEDWTPSKGWINRFKERYSIKQEPKLREENVWSTALEAAEYLLEYINNRDYQLKDVITVRMIRDRIAAENEVQSEYIEEES